MANWPPLPDPVSNKPARVLNWILAVFVALILLMIVAGLINYALS
ncbi:hypothetical protein [Palleronia sp.]